MVASAPADSATVLLLREAGAGCEVLLMRRHERSRSFAGLHVFPGGLIDAADAAPEMVGACEGLTGEDAATRLREDLAPARALGLWIGAIRELFEEAGILLASTDGRPLVFAEPATAARFSAHRAALLARRLTFAELVAHERLRLQTGALEYFSRWITPLGAPRRYDTRFFAARVPAGQEPLHDAQETTSAEWLTPREALARARAGTVGLAPPTMRTLIELEELGDCDGILRAARAHRAAPILPKVVEVDGQTTILYPGDVAYDDAVPGTAVVDAHGARNRLVLERGAWRSVRSSPV